MPAEILFSSGHLGYGDSRRQVASGRYHRTMNMRATVPGVLLPAEAISLPSTGLRQSFIAALDWETTARKSILLAAAGGRVFRYEDASVSEESNPGAPIFDLALHEDGSGTEYVYAALGDTTTMRRRSKAAVWSVSGDTTVKALYLEPLDDGRLVRAVPISGADRSYQISILPQGSNAMTVGNWGSNIQVGSPTYTITALTHMGDVILPIKEDGVYAYNPTDGTFRNLTPNLQPHKLNGKGSVVIPGLGVLVPLASGDLILIDTALQAHSVGPMLNALPDRNTPRGRIVTLTHHGHWILAALEVAWRRTQRAGLTVLKEDGGVFTDLTVLTTDQSDASSSSGAVGELGLATTDYLYVGADVPIEAAVVEIGTANTGGIKFDALEYTPVSGGWGGPLQIIDTTMSLTGSLGQDGFLATQDAEIGSLAATASVNSITKYWLRFRVPAGSGFTAGTTLKEVYAVPSRPSLGLTTPDYTGRDAASMVQHILAGRVDLDPPVWHDLYAFQNIGQIGAMLVTQSRHAASTAANGGPLLAVFGGGRNDVAIALIGLGTADDPRAFPYAASARSASGIPEPIFVPERLKFKEEHRLSNVLIHGEYVNSADRVDFYYRWDRNPWVRLARLNSLPARIPVEANGQGGLELECAITLNDAAATEAVVPSISRIEVEVEPTGRDWIPQRNASTPELE